MRLLLFATLSISLLAGENPLLKSVSDYTPIHQRLVSGWNTWDSRNVLSQVLLPQGLAVNLSFKQHYWLEEQYLRKALIGRRGKDAEKIKPGPHTLNGDYSELEIQWEQLHARIETAHVGQDLVVLVTPLKEPEFPIKMIIESALLWNRPGHLQMESSKLRASFGDRSINIFTTGTLVEDPYVDSITPHLIVPLDQAIGISTGKKRTLKEIQDLVGKARQSLNQEAKSFGDLSEAWIAVQSGIAWNTIYEPKFDRVVSTVGRLWNEEYGGYCLFGWDNFFLAYMTSLYNRDLAIANILEHLEGRTKEGFIPNDNQGNGRKSRDRSQPPVGSIMVKEIYKRFPEKWFLEAAFDPLLGWNRWWIKKRLNEGLLSYGSHEAWNPWKETYLRSMKAAGYESGMDDSPMYEGVSFNKEKNTMELQDVGLNSLYIADCLALAEMAAILGRPEKAELEKRAQDLIQQMETLWDSDSDFYLNFDTGKDVFSKRLSPTLFYPMLAQIPSKDRAHQMMKKHFFNPEEFWGDYMLPSIARNDPAFQKQRYWKGAIWPPLNFLTYLSLRNYGFSKAQKALSEKSLSMFIKEWLRKGYVSENYSSITGTGDDERLSSDRFHSWGALFGFIAFIEAGHLAPTETSIGNAP